MSPATRAQRPHHLGAHNSWFWIAEEQDRRDGENGDHEWRAFDTWAEAIAWADQMAREGERG